MGKASRKKQSLPPDASNNEKMGIELNPALADLKIEIIYLPLFFVLTCIYFSEVFLKGSVLAIGDGFDEFYPLMITVSNQYKDFIFPFWNPYMYSGFPLFGSMHVGALYPFNIVLPLLFSPTTAYNLNLMFHYALAGFFTFLYSRQIGLGVFPSLVAGTVFSLLGYLPAHLVHPAIITSAAWVPFLLYFFERLKQSLNIKYALYASFIVALQIFAGHPQICFYTYLLLMLYSVFHMFFLDRSQRMRFAFFSAIPLLTGVLLTLPQIVSTYELSKMAYRAKTTYEFFSSFAFPVHMITGFLFPFFYYYGGGNGEYWGPVPQLGEEAFVGTLPFLLAIVVMTRWKKDPHILFWGGIAILAFILALGDAVRPLNRLLFHLPGYNSFRGLSKHIIEMSFAMSVLAGFGVSFLQDTGKNKRFSMLLVIVISAVIAASVITFTFFDDTLRVLFKDYFSGMNRPVLSGGTFNMLRWEHVDIPEKALSMVDPSIYIPVITMSVYLICVLFLMKAGKKLPGSIAMAVIFVVIIAEAISYKQGPLPNADYVENHNREIYDSILSDGNSGRTVFIWGKILPLSAITHGIRLVEGYDPFEIGDYGKILPSMHNQTPDTCYAVINNNSVLSMMGVRYLVVDNVLGDIGDIMWHMADDEEGRRRPFPPVARKPANAEPVSIYRKIANFPTFSLYKNSIALPRAHSVRRLKSVNSAEDLIQKLSSYRLDPWQEAALSMEDLRYAGTEGFSPGEVKIVEDRPDMVSLTATFTGKGFVVLADQFYPDWEAYIDGKQTKIYKTNWVQRGVVVPEGEHMIVFKYVPRRIYASMLFSGLLFGSTLLILVRSSSLHTRRDRSNSSV